jgi:hypothetical protein
MIETGGNTDVLQIQQLNDKIREVEKRGKPSKIDELLIKNWKRSIQILTKVK